MTSRVALVLAEPAGLLRSLGKHLEGWHAPDEERPGHTTQHRADGHLRARPVPSDPTFRPPAFVRTAAELQQHVERLGAGTVAAVLGLRLEDLVPLLAGRVEPTPALLRRLRRASSADTD